MSNANMSNANMSNATMSNANISNANMTLFKNQYCVIRDLVFSEGL